MATLGRSGDAALAERFAAALAAELRAVGITLDYAPVLDIHTNPKNPVIGDRALAETADDVARLGAAIIRGLQERRRRRLRQALSRPWRYVTDSHLELPLVEHPPDRLRARGVRAVPRRHRGRRGVHHDRPRARSVARRDAARDAVAGASSRTPPRRAGLRRRDPERRPRDEGHRQPRTRCRRRPCRRSPPGATAFSSAAATMTCRRRRSRRSFTRSRTERLPLTRVEDALARQRRAKERFLAASPAALAARGRCSSSLGQRRAPGAWRRRWRASRDGRSRAPSTGRPCGGRRAGEPVQRERFRPRHRELRAPRVRRRSSTTACSRGDALWPGRPRARAAALAARLARSRRSRHSSRCGRLRQRAAPAAARSPARSRRAKLFIGYSDTTAILTFSRATWARRRFTARCWIGGSARAAPATIGASFVLDAARREPLGCRCRRRGS